MTIASNNSSSIETDDNFAADGVRLAGLAVPFRPKSTLFSRSAVLPVAPVTARTTELHSTTPALNRTEPAQQGNAEGPEIGNARQPDGKMRLKQSGQKRTASPAKERVLPAGPSSDGELPDQTPRSESPSPHQGQLDAKLATSGSKQSSVIRMLHRKDGATIADLMQITGWQVHSVRGFLSGTVRKRHGLNLISDMAGDGTRRYRIDVPAGEDGIRGDEENARRTMVNVDLDPDSRSAAANKPANGDTMTADREADAGAPGFEPAAVILRAKTSGEEA